MQTSVKRTNLVRVVPRPIELVDWEKVEDRGPAKERPVESNGEQQQTLFD